MTCIINDGPLSIAVRTWYEFLRDRGRIGDVALRITEAQAQKNRDKVLAKASRLFRERGFDGVSVGELMKAAGLTHGGFYNHFSSKESLVSEAVDHAFRAMDVERARMRSLEEFVVQYLSEQARDAPGFTCAAAALAGDVSRQPEVIRQVFAEGLERMIGFVQERLEPDLSARSIAIDLVCRMIGALVLARAVPASNSLHGELLANATEHGRASVTKSKKSRKAS
jgi:TetR/AcrR family transcriptional repressor of nem operon